ncbi:MAG: hypothetical protein ACRD51_09600, partial [Candidatus Acidiferrum sp.]
LANRSYDALLCDLNLSQDGVHLSGEVAARQLIVAAGARKPAVIFMTGELIESREPSGARGAPSYLQKPFRVSDVLATLQELFADNSVGPSLE